MTPLVELDRVSVRLRGIDALHDVSLRVSAGERMAVVGANGSGKSTLLRMLHGLLVPSQGRRTASAGLRQAMVFQRPHVMRASALWNVRLALWFAGVRGAEAIGRARAALAAVGLEPQAQRRATELSGGQQQRLALARAWAVRPDMLLLDEPTASLDPTAKREVEALITDYAGRGVTLVLASHNLGQVKRLATRVVCLGRGRVLADLPVAEFFDAQRLAEVSPEALAFVQGEG